MLILVVMAILFVALQVQLQQLLPFTTIGSGEHTTSPMVTVGIVLEEHGRQRSRLTYSVLGEQHPHCL